MKRLGFGDLNDIIHSVSLALYAVMDEIVQLKDSKKFSEEFGDKLDVEADELRDKLDALCAEREKRFHTLPICY